MHGLILFQGWETSMMIPQKTFAGFHLCWFSFMTFMTDLHQLPLVRGKHVFSQISNKDSLKDLLCLQLCYLFSRVTCLNMQN